MNRSSKVPGSLFVLMTALVLLAGCGGGGYGDAGAEAEAKPSADVSADATADAQLAVLEISPEAAAVLAKADLADGTEDHVVEKCASCNLAMDGKAENALQVGEYEMHFCSNTCSKRFEENAEEAILNLPQP